ncbi:MAG TPA: XisI protein [Cyanobacteria bacterium UBA11372]|nr:XisI protein [Cyanobacteria bacterium UBA11372]
MEKLDYRQLIKELLKQHAKQQAKNDPSETELIFAPESDRYLLVYLGWHGEKRIYACPIHIDIKDEKIWIQRDFTEAGIAQQLVEQGVPKSDIVLGFRSPFVRQFSEYAAI